MKNASSNIPGKVSRIKLGILIGSALLTLSGAAASAAGVSLPSSVTSSLGSIWASTNVFSFKGSAIPSPTPVVPADEQGVEINSSDERKWDPNSEAALPPDESGAILAAITVTTTADTLDAAGACASVTVASLPGPDGQTSLREAVCAANSNPGADSITFSVNGTFALTGSANEDNGGTGDLDIKQSLTITGNGTANTVLDGSANERIFDVFPSAASTFGISDMTLQNGETRVTSFREGGAIYLHNNVTTTMTSVSVINNFSGANGAIENRGNLTITDCRFVNNQTITGSGTLTGGAIHNAGPMSIDRSTFQANLVRGEGGAIATTTGVAVTVSITNSTFLENEASVAGGGLGNGGAISTTGNQGTINITNSTISGNRADNNGGGAYFVTPGGGTGNVVLSNVTVANNTADNDNNGTGAGGGLTQNTAAVTLRSTIVAGNFNSTAATRDDLSGAFNSASSFNLIGDGTGSTGIVHAANNNQVGSNASPIAPLLGLLANNGGPTETHALLAGSPAIDTGSNPTGVSFDQRGTPFARTVGTSTDVGAFEANLTPGAPTIGTATPTAPRTIQITWANGSPASSTFRVYRAAGTCASPGAFMMIASGLAGSPYSDTSVFGGNTYAYRVTGVDSSGSYESAPSGCVQATATGAPEANGVLQFSSATYSVGESAGSATLTVTRTGGSDGAVAVNYTLGSGTATGGAACGGAVDYVNTGNTISFANGETSKTFTVGICLDSNVESNETFTVSLSSPTGGATLGTPATAAVTIVNYTPDPVVNTLDNVKDGICDSVHCSLRDAIDVANSNADASTITFSVSGTINLDAVDSSSAGNNGLPIISSAMTINGGNAITVQRSGAFPVCAITTDPQQRFRVLFISGTGNLTLDGLTISRGCFLAADGARSGGGVYNDGTLNLNHVTVSGNAALSSGGGIYLNGGAANIANSTISNNAASNGAGILTNHGTVNIVNSTLSGNAAVGFGGGHHAFGSPGNPVTINISSSTIANNTAGNNGAALIGTDANYVVRNSIIQNNTGGSACSAAGFSGDFNLRDDTSCPNSSAPTPANPVTNFNSTLTLNPPGPTQTHAISAGSNAIDAAGFSCQYIGAVPFFNTIFGGTTITIDQIGKTRSLPCDIGAFENPSADLTVDKSHTGDFFQGQLNTPYSIVVTNSGGSATSGTVTVVDTLPAGLVANTLSGPGWSCTIGTLTCTRSDVLAIGASYPAITLYVNVASNAPASVTNSATVSGGGETNTSNNTDTDPTTINANTAPVANPDSYSTNEDTPLVVPAPGVLGNDTDAENNTITVYSFTQPGVAAGGVAMTANGSLTFTPALNYNGPASFTYRITDGGLQSTSASVSITVNAVNDAPVISSTPPANATEDLLYTYNATFTDVDGPGSAWSLFTGNTCSGAIINPTTGVYTFTAAGPVPPVSCVISVQVCDTGTPSACATQTTTIPIAAVNDAPSITAASGISRVQGTSSSSQIASVSDPDNSANTLAVTVNNAASATVNGVTVSGISVNAAGQVSATVSAACGSTNASFTLRVTDPGPGSQTAMATLNITVVNETVPPVINPITNVVAFLPPNSSATSMPVSFPLPTATDNCSVPTVTTSPVSGSVFNVGTTTINVTAMDANGNAATATFTVTVRYNFSGFTGRTLSPPAVNYASAGNMIPVSFNLSGDKGLNIFAPGSPSSQQVNCMTGTPIGASTPASLPLGLQYFGGQYQFYWQTTNVWAGTCRVLTVAFNDGSAFTANFTFFNNGATFELKGGEKKATRQVRPDGIDQ